MTYGSFHFIVTGSIYVDCIRHFAEGSPHMVTPTVDEELSRQVSSAYSLSTCGFRLFDPHKELERLKNLGQLT